MCNIPKLILRGIDLVMGYIVRHSWPSDGLAEWHIQTKPMADVMIQRRDVDVHAKHELSYIPGIS